MQLSVREVAQLLKVTEKTVYRWIRHDELPSYSINGQHRFNRSELLEWATSRKINVPLELFHVSDTEPLPSFAAALEKGGVFTQVPGADKDAVFKGIVERLRLPAGVDRDLMLRMLVAREALASTGIGDGLAIPHPRNPIVLRVPQPLITLFFLAKPIAFGALDGQPVYALFTLISPTPRVHLHMLARLSFALREPGFKDRIIRQAPADEIIAEAHRVEQVVGQSPSSAEGSGPV